MENNPKTSKEGVVEGESTLSNFHVQIDILAQQVSALEAAQKRTARLQVAGLLLNIGVLILILILLVTSIELPALFATPQPTQAAAQIILPPTPREAFKTIDNYVVYYGTDRLTDLAKFDLAVIQPNTLTDDELSLLSTTNTLALAYLSIGEVEPNHPFFNKDRVQETWKLGENQNWGSFYIDTNQPGWHDLVIRAAGDYLSKGFKGIFLDTVDTVDLFPNTKTGMIQLIQEIREAFPATILVQNRGFTILDQTNQYIDGIMFESLSTTYDFAKKTYERIDPETHHEIITQLQGLKQDTGLITLALDYASATDFETIRDALRIASDYGFIGSVSEIDLASIYNPNDKR